MSTVTGKVQRVYVNDKGKSTTYSVLVNESWYSNGFVMPSCKEGDEVSFEVVENGKYKNVKPKTLKIVATAEAPMVPIEPKSGKTTRAVVNTHTTVSRDDYWANKEKRDGFVQKEIRYQASRNAAIAFVTMLLNKDLVPLPAKKDKVEVVEQLVFHYTQQYYVETLNVSTKSGEVQAPDDDNVKEADLDADYDG